MATTEQAEFVPKTDELLYQRQGPIAFLTFNRPQARNALTWPMYEGLYDCCEHVEADDRPVVVERSLEVGHREVHRAHARLGGKRHVTAR